jgi:hypothetical protein
VIATVGLEADPSALNPQNASAKPAAAAASGSLSDVPPASLPPAANSQPAGPPSRQASPSALPQDR